VKEGERGREGERERGRVGGRVGEWERERAGERDRGREGGRERVCCGEGEGRGESILCQHHSSRSKSCRHVWPANKDSGLRGACGLDLSSALCAGLVLA
jgi:hypothetical protein